MIPHVSMVSNVGAGRAGSGSAPLCGELIAMSTSTYCLSIAERSETDWLRSPCSKRTPTAPVATRSVSLFVGTVSSVS
jgi:hypothetical protein